MKKINSQMLYFKLGFTNNFLIRLQKGYLLVDTSYSNKYKKFLKELQKANIALKEISYLVLTHHHDDHVGFARKILLNTQARLIVHNNALSFLKLGIHDKTGKHWNWAIDKILNPLAKVQKHTFPPFNIRKDDIILHNDNSKILSEIGLEGKIITTPGHSSDSISLVFANGEAIVGDAAMNIFNLGVTKYRPFFIQNIDDIFKSWKKLINSKAKILFPSHGKPIPIEKLKKTLANHKSSTIERVE